MTDNFVKSVLDARFREGVEYALNCIEEVFGEEVRRTDIWIETFGEDEDE